MANRPATLARTALVPFAAAFLLPLLFAAPVLRAQEAISPLPPPVTRSLYRSHWFDFLSALLEDDAKASAAARRVPAGSALSAAPGPATGRVAGRRAHLCRFHGRAGRGGAPGAG